MTDGHTIDGWTHNRHVIDRWHPELKLPLPSQPSVSALNRRQVVALSPAHPALEQASRRRDTQLWCPVRRAQEPSVLASTLGEDGPRVPMGLPSPPPVCHPPQQGQTGTRNCSEVMCFRPHPGPTAATPRWTPAATAWGYHSEGLLSYGNSTCPASGKYQLSL